MRIVPRCFVPGCQTGYPSDRKRCKAEGKKCLDLFSVPRKETMLEKWKKALPPSFREFKWTDYVCIKHFHEDDVDLYCIKTLPDGTSSVVKRKNPRLKSSAVPSIFPGTNHMPKVPSVKQSEPKQKKIETQAVKLRLPISTSFKPPAEVYQVPDQTMPEDSELFDVGLSSISSVVPSFVVSEESNVSAFSVGTKEMPIARIDLTSLFPPENIVSFASQNVNELPKILFISDEGKNNPDHFMNQKLMENKQTDPSQPSEEARTEGCYLADCLPLLILPSKKWTVHATANNYIVCAYWVESSLEPIKRVVILNDLSVRIFLNEVEIDCFVRITTLGVLYSLLEEVEKYRLCKESKNPSSNCIGIVTSQRSLLCLSCFKAESNEKRRLDKTKRAMTSNKGPGMHVLDKSYWLPKIREELKRLREKENQIAELQTLIKNERILNKELRKLDADL